MENEFGFKELYDVTLKTTFPIEVKGRSLEAGETIAAFEKIQIANFQESKNNHSAHGGWDDRSYVYWTTTREITVQFVTGIFSQDQLSLLLNAKLVSYDNEELLLSRREKCRSNIEGIIELKHAAVGPIFVYDKTTSNKIPYTVINDTQISIEPNTEVVIDYKEKYERPYQVLTFGTALTNGLLTLEGKTRIKDDVTGHVRTALVRMPKIRLISGLSMRLGDKAMPYVPTFSAVAIPDGPRGNTKAMEMIFLSDDIDSDI